MDHNSLRKLVEGQLLRLEGNAFQDCMDRLGLELYPSDYQPVRAAGPKGDTKNDGYCAKARVFFAAHATRGERIDKTKAKIRGDLEGCLQEHRNVRVWRFLTNDTLPGEVDQFIDNELRPLHPAVIIEVWGLKMLADEISKLKREQVDRIIDVISAAEPRPKLPEKPQVVQLSHMQTGRDLWPILSISLAWLPAVEPDGCTEEEEDLIDGVVQTFTDWLEISGDVEARSRAAVRDAQRGITELLNELKAKNLAVYSGTIDDHPIGDSASPILVSMAIFKIVRVTSEQPSPSAS
ncbi:hypothetical protein [Streptomyces spiramyceticus]|uniref:hypothetical protein n=1 Tax=Streptomyces spiramyceticus TaxID=299717 RepID=UPI00237B1CFA|nr:hypothetical protein [Streptomyces spiramyceticus]